MSILERVKDSVEELEVAKQASASIFEYIFKNFHKLKRLELDADRIPSIPSGALRPMPGVVKLILHSGHHLPDGVFPFIGSLPNVETLVINSFIEESDSNRFMTFFASNLPKLRVLEIKNVVNSTFKDLKMPCLRTLLIHNISIQSDGLKSMTQCCANIEKLAIDSPYNLSSYRNPGILIVAEDLKKLEWIYLGLGFIVSKTLLSEIFIKLPELKTLTLIEDAVKDIPEEIENFPRLIIAKKSVKFSETTDPYAGEDAHFVDYDFNADVNFGSDFDDGSELDIDLDEEDGDFVRYDDIEDWQPGDDDNSDDEYMGNARPG